MLNNLVPVMQPHLVVAQPSGFAYQGLSIALPVFVTAMACGGLVPTLVEHYQGDAKRIQLSLFLGTLITLFVYVAWIAIIFSVLGRAELLSILSDGGGLSELLASLKARLKQDQLSKALIVFSHFAVITSFLSVSLGHVHFLIDRFGLKRSKYGRFKGVALAFLPPLIASLLVPYGFVKAISFAGLFVAFSFFIIPALLVKKKNLIKPI